MAEPDAMESIFGEGGLYAAHVAGYEVRPGQLRMAQAVDRLLCESDDADSDDAPVCASLVIEAETGLGKTQAYLAPAVRSGKRVVISTHTRNLQDQILQRELPLLLDEIDPGLKAICVKGRQNYLCLYRWHQVEAETAGTLLQTAEHQAVAAWVKRTVHGDRAELDSLPAASPLWQKICCQSHFCLGQNCPDGPDCFLNRLRRDAAASRLLIVNHHLLFSDLAVRRTGYGEVLPRYEAVIFDEAHHIEEVATTFFGFSCSQRQVLELAADIGRSAESECSDKQQARLRPTLTALTDAANQLAAAFPPERGRFLLQSLPAKQADTIIVLHESLQQALSVLCEALDQLPEDEGPWQAYLERAEVLSDRLERILVERFDDLPESEHSFTHWYERSERNLSLFATPVDIAPELRETLFSAVRFCVFTSATLTTGGNFTYFLRRLGLPEDTPTLSLPSPFDYPNRALLYVPATPFPQPGAPDHPRAMRARMEELIGHAGGRTLVLFTSFAAMEQAHAYLSGRLPYPLLLQGEAPRNKLLRRFTRETDSVLLAVASFWEGVDIPGESLSLVVIDKLPFEVPSDPVIMARSNRIKALGGNPFFDLQVPRAILTLRQGAGRLMRSSADRGVIAILDTRLFTKNYGRQFLASLPPMPLTRDLNEVAAFFAHKDP
ncbi:MAG: ATP-dependent DNA helicase [Desulfobulbus sp.]|jgi:ATP-dependent DNA helicase DinG